MKRIVIGIATGSNDIETWFLEEGELMDKFCRQLAEKTGRAVYVMDGTIVGKYEVKIPVEYTTINKSYVDKTK